MVFSSFNERLNVLENQEQKLNASYDKQDDELPKTDRLKKDIANLKSNLTEEKKELEKISRNRSLKEFFICVFKHIKNKWNGVPTPENERVWTQLSLLNCAIGLLAVLTVISIVADRFFPVQSTSPGLAWQRV